jgi:hypothetical protein
VLDVLAVDVAALSGVAGEPVAMTSVIVGAGIIVGLAVVEKVLLVTLYRWAHLGSERVDTVTECVISLLIVVTSFLVAKHGSFVGLLLGAGVGGMAVWCFRRREGKELLNPPAGRSRALAVGHANDTSAPTPVNKTDLSGTRCDTR